MMVRPITCPICETSLPATDVSESKFFPFCSERCRNVDLLRWSQGKYAIVESLTADRLQQIVSAPEAVEDELS